MKKFCLVWLCLLIQYVASAQNDAFFSHYTFNRSFYNPAAVGADQIASVALQFRAQWVGYSSSFDGSGGAPSSQLLSASFPINSKIVNGAGLHLLNDNLGPVSNFSVQFPVSRAFELRSGVLHLGLMPGLISSTLKGGELRAVNPDDDLIPNNSVSQLNFNLGAGAYFKSSKGFYLGVSLLNLLEPSFDFTNESQNKVARSLNILGGFTFDISRNISLTPSALIRSNVSVVENSTLDAFGDFVTFDVSLFGELKDLAWAGVSFRRAEALILFIGWNFLSDKSLKVGYSLDYVIDEQDAKQPTSQEFIIKYNLPNFIFGGKKRVVTPRFTTD